MTDAAARKTTRGTQRRGSRRQREEAAAESLALLGAERVEMLARYEGQSLDELQGTLQLLPLGTRLGLEAAGAINLWDKGEDYFYVEVLPFARDLVEAAVAQQANQRRHAAGSQFEAEVDRIWEERFALVENTSAPAPTWLKDTVDVVGTFQAPGRLTDIDPETRIASIEVIGHAGRAIRNALVHYAVADADRSSIGKLVELNFVVGLPRAQRFKAPWSRSRTVTTIRDIEACVSDQPGTILVKYAEMSSSSTPVISFGEGSRSNAVAGLSDVSA